MVISSELKYLVAIVIVGFAVFANSLGGDFVSDDDRQIVRNPLIQDFSLAGKALTSDVWAFKGDGKITASNYWRPTFTAWQIVNFQLFGLNVVGWHFLSVLLHIGVCVLAFLLLRRWGFSEPISFGVVLIFAVHPVHVESVAWISGSTDLLFAFFLLASLWFAENRRKGCGTADLVFSLLFFALALGAKEVAIFCVPIYFLIFARTDASETDPSKFDFRLKRTFATPAVFVFVGAIYFAARWAVLGRLVHQVENATSAVDAAFSIPTVFLFYLKQLTFPWTISINHALRPVNGFDPLGVVLPAIVTVAVLTVLVVIARRRPVGLFGLMLFLLPLAAAFNLTAFPSDQIVHERYLYLPLLGFLILVAVAAESRFSGRTLMIAAVVVSIPLGIRSVIANRAWANDLALWQNAVATDPGSAANQAQYGTALATGGRHLEAIEAFNASLDIAPNQYAYVGRAQALITVERFEEAVWDLQTVTEMKSEETNVYTLFQAYEALAVALQNKNDLVSAERYLREARQRLPIYHAALTEKIAIIMYRRNNKSGALVELRNATSQARSELLPASKSVFFRLGLLYAETGDKAAARWALQEFLKLTAKSSDAQIQNDRKMALETLRTIGEQ